MGLSFFVVFIHDLDCTWKKVAQKDGIFFSAQTGTRIIVDDIFSWARSFEEFITYLTCQLEVCMSQNLSLLLKKCLFCQGHMEFVGHDGCPGGNCPAQPKHSLLKTWPAFRIARDVASFLGFLNLYAYYIPYFEQCVAPLKKCCHGDGIQYRRFDEGWAIEVARGPYQSLAQ